MDRDGETHWFWPSVHVEPGAMVHCGSPVRAGKRPSEGYAGRTMHFPTKEGVIAIQGPWHSNSDALYKRTGVDLRDKHLTFGLVALQRTHRGNDTVFKDVLYIDPQNGVIGRFKRIQDMAQAMADERDEVVFYYQRSHGGASNGPLCPSSWSKAKVQEYWKLKGATS
jgi:hypothetical protein